MLTKTLLAFTLVCNLATLFGLWIAYEASPATLQAKIGHVLLLCGATASILAYIAFAIFVMRPKAHESKNSARQLEAPPVPPQPKLADLPKPDASVKDSDPRIEIEFRDERYAISGAPRPEEAYFTPVNRGGNAAKCVCLEPIRLKGHTISFPTFSYDLPRIRGDNMRPVVTRNDGQKDDTNFLKALFEEYGSFQDGKMHELPAPMIATYQDDSGNLFQTKCELVFSPSDYVQSTTFGDKHARVVEIRNHKFKKIAAAIF